jgi:hypothetical protein
MAKKKTIDFCFDDTDINLMKEELLKKLNDEIIADLEAKLDIAYREQEQMLKELKRWTDAFPYAFRELEEHAGKITSEDVTYHAKLLLKIMENKFGYKPKMTEL